MGDNAKKITGMNKTTDVTMKRGAVASAQARDVEKLPNKKTPPTLILKRSKDGGTELGPIPRSVPEPKIPKK